MKSILFLAFLLLAGCSDQDRPNIAYITASQWQAAESWCAGLQGMQSATVRNYYYSCGRGCGYKLDYQEVVAVCNSGQAVSQRFPVKRDG